MRLRLCDDFESCFIPVTETGCWLWLYSTNEKGYGRINIYHASPMAAHRFSYEKYVGPIPEGMLVCHTCDTPSCVNPKHLFLGSNMDNMIDKIRKGRQHHGDQSKKRKITSDMARSIFTSKGTHISIGLEYGITQSAVTRIKNRQSWARETAHIDSGEAE